MNDFDTFISISEDCTATGEVPSIGKRSIAEVQYAMLVEQPYRFNQEDVLFASSAAMREDPDKSDEEQADLRKAFFARSQACLRASPLPKRWGWGIHFDHEGKAAAFAAGSEEYRRHAADGLLRQTKGMRTKRG